GRKRKKRARRDDAVRADDHRAIVKRSSGDEDADEQFRAHHRIDNFRPFLEGAERLRSLDDDQRSYALRREDLARTDNGRDVESIAALVEPGDDRIAAHARETSPDLVLKEHDDGEGEIEEGLARDRLERREIERTRHEKRAAEHHQADRDLHRSCSADQREDAVDDHGNDEHVDEIAPGELQRKKPVEPAPHARASSMAASTLRKSAVSRTS